MTVDEQIHQALDAIQQHTAARLDAYTLIHRFSGRSLLIARGGISLREKWALIEEERRVLCEALLRVCVEYQIDVPMRPTANGQGVPDAPH